MNNERKQDRKTQRLFDNVTKSLLTQNNGLKRDPETGILYEEPLKEEHPIGSLLLLRGAGPAAAKGFEFIGEKMMPSALLKGIGQTFPKLAKATTAISPYADAGLLATWGAQGLQEAKEAVKSGDTAGAIAGASMATLPLMGINPEVAQELTTTQKANKVARTLNKEIRTSDLIQGTVPKSKEIIVKPTLKQTRVVSEGTYPLYTGPKHSVTEVVNPNGTVNPRAALRIEREVADNIPGAYRMESRLENPEWHVNDPNTWAHTRNVAQSAWTVPTPKGLTKQDQMVAALGHDFGKMVSGDGHAQSSAALIEQIFPDVTEQQLTAISEHMGAPKSILGKVTKQADILNGKPAITRFVGDNGKIRLRLPSHTAEKPRELVLDPQGNNKFRVHTRTWDGDHIPAEMSGEDKNTLFNALYEELPEGAEILFPESGPGNYATRGTVAGLQRLARDSRFKPTSKGVLQYVDKDGSIKTFEGAGFKKPKPIKLVSRPISEAEKLGIPKGERNQPENPKVTSKRYFLDSEELFPRDVSEVIPDDALVPNGLSVYKDSYRNQKNRGFNFIDWLEKEGVPAEENISVTNKINRFAEALPEYDARFAREDGRPSFYISQFREYLSSLGYDTKGIPDENILKLITHQYKNLTSEATGKLKGRLVFHGTNTPFESFDYAFTGKNTGNPGYNGAGNYFATYPTQYGGKTIKSFLGTHFEPGLNQPYMISGIKSTPLNDNNVLPRTVKIPYYRSPKDYGTEYAKINIDRAINMANEGKVKNMAIIDDWGGYPGQLYVSDSIPVSEFSVARNNGIKSLFPHPSRFVQNTDGTISLTPTNWSDIRVNFKQGGILKQTKYD